MIVSGNLLFNSRSNREHIIIMNIKMDRSYTHDSMRGYGVVHRKMTNIITSAIFDKKRLQNLNCNNYMMKLLFVINRKNIDSAIRTINIWGLQYFLSILKYDLLVLY